MTLCVVVLAGLAIMFCIIFQCSPISKYMLIENNLPKPQTNFNARWNLGPNVELPVPQHKYSFVYKRSHIRCFGRHHLNSPHTSTLPIEDEPEEKNELDIDVRSGKLVSVLSESTARLLTSEPGLV